jgi:hypothetical protein
MAKIERVCETCNESFNADTREVNRGRAKYCSRSCANKVSKDQQYDKICKHCAREYQTASKQSMYCSTSCKQKNYRLASKSDDISIKAIYKIFENKPCELCGWSESTCDIHHIVEVSDGGKNELDNLVVVCPNHHRMIHNDLISKDKLSQLIKDRTISSP